MLSIKDYIKSCLLWYGDWFNLKIDSDKRKRYYFHTDVMQDEFFSKEWDCDNEEEDDEE